MSKDVDFKELRAELDQVLAKLQSDDVEVDNALALYERGIEITKQLEAYLKTAENKISKVKAKIE